MNGSSCLTTGISLDFLFQLLLVFEGLSFWKLLKLPEKVSPSDYTTACESTLNNPEAKTEDKVDILMNLRRTHNKFSIWQRVVSILDNAIPTVVIILAILILSLFFDLEKEKKICIEAVSVYVIGKSALYFLIVSKVV